MEPDMVGPRITGKHVTIYRAAVGIIAFAWLNSNAEPLEVHDRGAALDAIEAQERAVRERFDSPDLDENGRADLQIFLDMVAEDRERVFRGDRARIARGIETADFPAVGALLSGIQTICTGTLVGKRSFLTAKHCFHNSDNSEIYSVYFQNAGIYRADPAIKPILSPDSDLAIIELKKDVRGIRPASLNELGKLPLNSQAVILGFGVTSNGAHDSGLKRYGHVLTGECPEELSRVICWTFTAPYGPKGEDSNTCAVDSGGPLFAPPNGGLLTGVTSAGSDLENCAVSETAWDVEVSEFKDWLNDSISNKEASADLPLCCTGNVGVHVFEGQIKGTGLNEKFRHKFDVPEATRTVRVAMNATERGAVDFDLSVRQGVGVSHSKAGCRQIGQYASCEYQFNQAPPSEWSFKVSRESSGGAGTIQVVVTLFETTGDDG